MHERTDVKHVGSGRVAHMPAERRRIQDDLLALGRRERRIDARAGAGEEGVIEEYVGAADAEGLDDAGRALEHHGLGVSPGHIGT